MKQIHIDLESYCDRELSECGVYRYAEDPSFEILLFAYAVDDGPVHVVDCASGEQVPTDVLAALTDDTIQKWAHNAAFERICLSRFLGLPQGRYLDPASWRCSMVWALTLGFPASLENLGVVLGLTKQKLREGRELISFFSKPCKPTKANGLRVRNLPAHAAEKWAQFKAYNRRDVEVEMDVCARLADFPVPQLLWEEYAIDQEINDRGIAVDRALVHKALALDKTFTEELFHSLQQRTGLANPKSRQQMLKWLLAQGYETESLDKKAVECLKKSVTDDVREVLNDYGRITRTSIGKYAAIQECVCADGRVRGMFRFYGAARTGRFAGQLVQLQNLPRNSMSDLDTARNLVLSGSYAQVKARFPDVSGALSELIRTNFVAGDGNQFIVADYAAIEARIIAWYAKEHWRLEAFVQGKDIYCASASKMFGVPVEKHGQNAELRQKGKIAELALGYGGSVGALKSMGALEMGLEEEELQSLVNAWRAANPRIVAFWWEVDNAVREALTVGYSALVPYGLEMRHSGKWLFIILPSGRRLAYPYPLLLPSADGREKITYEGVDPYHHAWGSIDSYGPKFVENIVQGTARDILCHALKNLRNHGYRTVAHVHDEVIIEAPATSSADAVCTLMAQSPAWAEGLLLRADGYTTNYYCKD